MTDHDIILAIQQLLDGVEWNSSTINEIATLLASNGYRIRDLEE